MSPLGGFVAVLSAFQLEVRETSRVMAPLWAAPEPADKVALTGARVVDGRLVLECKDKRSQPLWASPKHSSWLRFTVLRTRGSEARSGVRAKQISELTLWDGADAVKLEGCQASTPGGHSPGNQGPEKAVDGSAETKWYGLGGAPLLLWLPRSVIADRFSFTTGDDMPDRDPVQWLLENSKDGVTWTIVHEQRFDFATPMERHTETDKFSLAPPLTGSLVASEDDASRLVLTDDGVLAVVTQGGIKTWSSGNGARSPQVSEPAEDEETVKARQMSACAEYLSCGPCISATVSPPGCGWCLATRRCVADLPWICQGQEDHVSRPGASGPGKRTCPTLQDIEEGHRKRRERVAAAALPGGETEEGMRSASDVEAEEKAGKTPAAEAKGTQGANDASAESYGGDEVGPTILKELLWRVNFAKEEKGTRPYNVLKVKVTASPSEIRKAYRRLSMQFHPDKWLSRSDALRLKAEAAFADIQKAYETIGAPDKRAAFDDYRGEDFSRHWQDEATRKWKGDEDFYFGDPLIATLTEDLWERRLSGQTVWLIEFYAAWCTGCRNARESFRDLARLLESTTIEVGAVNCVRQGWICGEYVGVTAYPSVRLLNREYGMMQTWTGNGGIDSGEIAKWVEQVSAEWRWLFRSANVHWDLGRSSFTSPGIVADSGAMWVVSFIDGRECPSCKATCTNLQRLSASLRGLPVEIGAVDCSLPENRDFCYKDLVLACGL